MSELPNKKMAKKRKSKYDDLFDFTCDNENNKEATCKSCTSQSPKKIRMKNGNTSGLKQHLQSQHKDVYQKLFNVPVPEEDETETVQPEDIYDEITDWIAKKYLDFTFFEDKHTQSLFKRLNPTIKYPKKDALKRKVHKRFEDLKDAVKNILSKNKSKFAFTIDGWTSVRNQSIYGITIHFIDDNWKLHSLALDFIPSHGKHTGEDISNIFYESVKEFNIDTKVQGITVDNVSANTTFMEHLSEKIPNFDSEDQHFRCIGHILNLGVQDFLTELKLIPDVPDGECIFDSYDDQDAEDEETQGNSQQEAGKSGNAVEKIRSLFIKIKRSEQLTIKLRQLCNAEEVPQDVGPILDVRTRWHSTHDMLQRSLVLKPALDLLCCRDPELIPFKLNDQEWEMIKKVCKLLKDFKKLSEMLGGEHYVTLPLVIGSFNLLLDKLEKLIANNLSKKKGRTALDEKMLLAYKAALAKLDKHYSKTNWVYCAVLLLDPRFKAEGFSQHAWGRAMYKASRNKFDQLYRTYCQEQGSPTGETDSDVEDDPEQSDEDMEIDFSSLYCKSDEGKDYKKELEKYLSTPRADVKQDILAWWKVHCQEFPTLSKMARDLLCITATSVPSERLFSRASLIMRKHRNRLQPESAKWLLCLNSWTTCKLASDIITYKK